MYVIHMFTQHAYTAHAQEGCSWLVSNLMVYSICINFTNLPNISTFVCIYIHINIYKHRRCLNSSQTKLVWERILVQRQSLKIIPGDPQEILFFSYTCFYIQVKGCQIHSLHTTLIECPQKQMPCMPFPVLCFPSSFLK